MAALGTFEARLAFEAAMHRKGRLQKEIDAWTPERDLAAYLKGEYSQGVPFRLTRRQPTATDQALGDRLVSRLEIANALRRLPYRQRRVIELRYIEGRTCDQVGLQLSISDRTVERDAGDALKQMAAWIYEWR